jgi:hemerythrin-like domain-containing protein
MAMDALTLVRQDHRRVENLLERVERLDDDVEERAVLIGQLRAALRHHVDAEEAFLYAIFRERARSAGVDLAQLDQAIEQHRLVTRLAGELAAAGPRDPALEAKLTVLVEQVRTHLDTEDSVLLTAVEDLLDDDTLQELGRRMEQRDRVVEARRELAEVVPGGPRTRRAAAALGGLVALGTGILAVLSRRRRPPEPTGWRRLRRR